MGAKYPVACITHEDGSQVLVWDLKEGIEVIGSCLNTHPEQPVTVSVEMMTEKQYDSLPDYDGDC